LTPRSALRVPRSADGHPDLLVTLGDSGPIYVYLFDAGKVALRPPTADEQRRLFLPERAP
jgi:hypothetical protein